MPEDNEVQLNFKAPVVRPVPSSRPLEQLRDLIPTIFNNERSLKGDTSDEA